MENIKIGIIGGTGLDNSDIIKDRLEKVVETPYGKPSDALICGLITGVECVIIPRHGRNHQISPSHVNFRANIWALKEEKCTHIIATTACGSLKEEIAPAHFVVLDQFIDRTTKRQQSFYDHQSGHLAGVCHIPMAEPFSKDLRNILIEACKECKVTCHATGTVVTIEGPRFSSRAESELFRSWNADLVNMTTVPEVVLAKEAGILYASLAMSTDYDCWRVGTEPVSVEAVIAVMKKNAETAVKVLLKVVNLIQNHGDWSKAIQEASALSKGAVM